MLPTYAYTTTKCGVAAIIVFYNAKYINLYFAKINKNIYLIYIKQFYL